jgi:hypothetical protein
VYSYSRSKREDGHSCGKQPCETHAEQYGWLQISLDNSLFFPTQVPSSIDINIYRQRQWDIRTCARSSLDPGMQVPPFIFQCQRQPCIDFSQSGREGSASEAQHN